MNTAKYLILFLGVFIFSNVSLLAQTEESKNLVQLSGLVLDGSTEELLPVPFTSIYIENETRRGTYSDFKGFFTIVAKKGEIVVFSTIGYKTVEFKVPDTLSDNRYSIIQLMTQDTINLPETVVFPWPSKEHFKIEFLAMDIKPEMQKRAAENVARDFLEKGRESVIKDGDENADFYLRQQANNYYHYGQFQPMNIFNPIAWGKFVQAWKNGDFKKKKKKE